MTKKEIKLTEYCASKDHEIVYNFDKGFLLRRDRSSKLTPWRVVAFVKQFLFEVFLPRGYPDSVSEDYIWYQVWDTLQACCSTLSGMLAVQAVLKGVGVGRDSATPLAAAITWFTKDGVGMVASIAFAWSKGSYLDSDCKKWRLFADVINDTALCMELSIAGLVDQTIPLLCLSSALKALVGVAGGATRAALTHHQALRGNTADVAAKDGSQETVVNLGAMSLGVFLLNSSFIQSNAWAVMMILVFLHVICNYKAVKALRLRKFNESRYLIALRGYLRAVEVASVEEVNFEESVILGRGYSPQDLCGFNVSVGNSIQGFQLDSNILESLLKEYSDLNYLPVYSVERKKISVMLRPNISDKEILKAYFHACLLGIRLNKESQKERDAIDAEKFLKNIDESFLNFSTCCEQQGWNMKEHVLHTGQWRAEWSETRLKTE